MESYNMCSWCLVSFTEHTFLRFIYVRACVSFFWRVIFHVWIFCLYDILTSPLNSVEKVGHVRNWALN